jgi:hypothetical protein
MDARVTELHCIMPIANLPSVVAHGILSYESAARLQHASVAMQPVQDRRDQRRVPQGLRLHQYANLYFNARNPMLYKRLDESGSLRVLRVSLVRWRSQTSLSPTVMPRAIMPASCILPRAR